MMAKHVSTRKTTFSSKNHLRKQWGTLRLVKVSERLTEPKKTRETYFLYRKPQKLQVSKNVFRNFLGKFYRKISLYSVSRKVPKKNKKWLDIAEKIN